LANNHSVDFGLKTFAHMLDLFDRQGLRYFGGGKNIRSAHEPVVFETKGKRIAVLGYDIFLPRSFEALPDQPGVAWGEPDFIAQDIARARQHHRADIVITYPHWGWENEKQANAQQQALAHWMIDSGADAVVGGHPHVTQNVELYKGKPVFYSLGNFIFNGFTDKAANTGWVLTLDIGASGALDWKIHQVGLNRQGIPTDMGPLPKPLP
jgi:poly-gamma-glutamate synthesis protein (capsule biosynthesis protein)